MHIRFSLLSAVVAITLVSFATTASQNSIEGIAAYNNHNYSSAVQLLTQAATQNDQEAQYWLGLSFEGLRDIPHATFWLRKAARQGNTDAQVSLGLIAYGELTLPVFTGLSG